MRAALLLTCVLCLSGCHVFGPADPGVANEFADARARLTELENHPDEATRKQAAAIGGAIDNLMEPDGTVSVESVSTGLGAVLPPPWNILAFVGVPAVVALIQQARVKKKEQAMRSVVNSIDALRIKAPQVNQYFREHSNEMHKHLTPDAIAAIRNESMV